MRWIAYLFLVAFAGCDKTAPAVASAAPTETFEPTAFTVEVKGEGRPVIFIPGLGCPGSVWDDTVAHLDGVQAHVVTIAGFAGVPRIDSPIAAQARAQLAQYIRANHLARPVIVGHSMGGFLAYWLASSEPDLVGPMMIVESGASLGDGDAQANAATGAQVRDMWSGATDEQFAAQVKDIFGAMAAHKDRLATFLDAIGKSDRRAIGDAIYEQFTTDIRSQLARITAPVLVVAGEGALADGFRKQAEGVPHHDFIQVPNAKHFVMLDEPEAFQRVLANFLTANPVGTSPRSAALPTPPSESRVAMSAGASRP